MSFSCTLTSCLSFSSHLHLPSPVHFYRLLLVPLLLFTGWSSSPPPKTSQLRPFPAFCPQPPRREFLPTLPSGLRSTTRDDPLSLFPLSLNLALGSRTSFASHTDPLVRPQSAFFARPLKKNGRTSLDSPSSSSLLHPLSDSPQAFSALAHTPLTSPRPPLNSYHDPLPTPRQL